MSARGERGPGRGQRWPGKEQRGAGAAGAGSPGQPRLSGAGRAGTGPWFSAGVGSGFGAGFVAGLPRRGRGKPVGLWKGSAGANGASPAAVLSREPQLNRLRVWGGSCPSLGARGDELGKRRSGVGMFSAGGGEHRRWAGRGALTTLLRRPR